MREATKQATLLLLFCLENRLILDTFNCLDLEDSVIAKLWNHIQQFIYNLSFRLYAVFWFWWDIEFGNLLKGLVRRRVLSRGHLYLWRSATRLLRDLSVCSLTEAWNDMLPHFITMDVSMAVCPISAYTKDCVLANAARRWQDWARSTCTGADACCHWKLPPTMGKVGKESKSSGRCAVLRRLWKNWNVQTAGPGRSTDKTERLRGLRSSGPGNIQTGIFDLMDDPVFEMRAFTKHFLSYYIIYQKMNINLHMFAILWILWIAKTMLCRRAMRSALLSCCLMFSSHYLLMHFRISMHLEARNCNWEPQAHCGPKGREREVALWRTFVACLIIGRSGFAKQARNCDGNRATSHQLV